MSMPTPIDPLQFPSLGQVMKVVEAENSKKKHPSHSKINIENFENTLFQQMALASQNKTLFKTLNDDPEHVQKLRDGYKHQIEQIAEKRKMHPEHKAKYLKAIEGAVNRFELLLSVRQSVFLGSPFHLETDRLAKIREEYLRHHHLKEIEEKEEFERMVEEDENAEEEEENKTSADLRNRDKSASEEEERHQREQFVAGQMAMASPNVAKSSKDNKDKLEGETLALSKVTPGDPKAISDTITQNLSDLNHMAGQTLQNTAAASSVKMEGMALEPKPEQMQRLNQDISSLEQTLRTNPNAAQVNPQLNQVLGAVHQQYQNVQGNIPANNAAGQQLLTNVGNQMEKNVTEWLMTGQVARYTETFKNELQKDWNATMNINPSVAPAAAPQQRQAEVQAQPQGSTPAAPVHAQLFSMQGMASAHPTNSLNSTTAAASSGQQPEQQDAKPSGNWPPKPTIPGTLPRNP